MFTSEQLQSFKAKIDSAETIALFGHHNIDWDAVWSILWLGTLLEKLGKKVSYFTTIPPTKYFNFVKDREKIGTDFNYEYFDLVWFLDFTGYNRIGWFTFWHELYFDNTNMFVVDHHIDDPWFLTSHALKLKDVDASSNCELLLEICHQLRPDLIDSTIATHWYMGLLTDTWMFQFQKDTVRTLENATLLIKYGADKDHLVQHLFNSSPKWLIEFMKLVTPRIIFTENTCSVRYTLDEVSSLWLDWDQAEAFMIFVRSIYWVAVYIEFKVEADRIRCSLRSWYTNKSRQNVQIIAHSLNWGWHMYAAGCAVTRNNDLSIEEQIEEIRAYIDREAGKQVSA